MREINPKVLEIGNMNLTGNLVPEAWFQNIVRESGKSYLTAIIILADIIYWYRPTEVRNEHTGKIIAYKQKFKSDMLQKSYDEISKKFGISKREATNAIVHLENLGLIKRVFRTVNNFPNTMFIDIFPKEIQKISEKIISTNKRYRDKKFSKDLISRVKKRCNYMCQRCGEFEKLDSFHVHHIISRRIKKYSRDENNLILLCPSCHKWVHSKLNINKEYIG